MQSLTKRFEILRYTKVIIQTVDILLPVAMEGIAVCGTIRYVVSYRGDPDLSFALSV